MSVTIAVSTPFSCDPRKKLPQEGQAATSSRQRGQRGGWRGRRALTSTCTPGRMSSQLFSQRRNPSLPGSAGSYEAYTWAPAYSTLDNPATRAASPTSQPGNTSQSNRNRERDASRIVSPRFERSTNTWMRLRLLRASFVMAACENKGHGPVARGPACLPAGIRLADRGLSAGGSYGAMLPHRLSVRQSSRRRTPALRACAVYSPR